LLTTYSHSSCATARLFTLKSLFATDSGIEWRKQIIITDSEADIDILRQFAKTVLGTPVQILGDLGEFWMMSEAHAGIFVIPTSLLETSGDMTYLRRHSLYEISRGTEQTIENTIEKLIEFGYTHAQHLGELATYRREGSIVTITDAYSSNMIHIEWFDTEIDSIIEIDSRSGERRYRDTISIKNQKLSETPIERKVGVVNMELLNVLDWVPMIILGCDFLSYIESLRHIMPGISQKQEVPRSSVSCEADTDEIVCKARGSKIFSKGAYEPVSVPQGYFLSSASGHWEINFSNEEIRSFSEIPIIHFTDFHRDDAISLAVDIPTIEHIDAFLAFLREERWEQRVAIYTKFVKTVQEFVEFHKIANIEIIEIAKWWMESCIMKDLILITDDIVWQVFVRTRNKKSIAKHLDLLLSLAPGDLVVHREHGIALFHSIIKKTLGQSNQTSQKRSISDEVWAPQWTVQHSTVNEEAENWIRKTSFSEVSREYLELHYAEWDKLFVPLTEIYRVSKYLGKPDVELTKLSGKEWEKTMNKTTEEIEAIALDILETNARRSLAKGRSFAKFSDKEKEFQDAFAYEYTRDQASAIEEVFVDMESELAMDRLISGDVGFGKTEIAMNAIYKAILSGTQVAVISPLLVLADEHYETFVDRLSPFGVRVGIMTRMSSAREITTTLEDLRDGKIDVVVGTHRLLSDDVRYKRLGLLVIDEEHKFWVTHKERIKKIRAGIDILALSATPIPRSLNLALSGLKKISIIATPPKKKKPIETIITRWDEGVIGHAIEDEMQRGWQVIILHNRIRGMDSLAKEIENIIENSKSIKQEAPRIIITHGQMPGDMIEDRIHAFKKREYDILLSTTIIENGVNFLSANTIIIIDPEEFGLASLHQLRGRVGRKDADAYCYLMYRKPELGKDEKERLITIANNTHLGAGFEIAMRDMEIRGAWDVLGIKQSGRSKDIGLTLYFRLLEERIAELREEKKKRILTKIELDISYILPEEYFLSEADKLNFFREIESLETLEELDEIENEINNPEFANLFLLIRTRLILSDYGVVKLSKIGLNYVFDLDERTTVADAKRFLDRFDSSNNMILLSVRKIRIEIKHWKTIEKFLENIIL
jgi:transcription-repair coupling factor (superfamily II helicase)